jgi:hypothetical protein
MLCDLLRNWTSAVWTFGLGRLCNINQAKMIGLSHFSWIELTESSGHDMSWLWSSLGHTCGHHVLITVVITVEFESKLVVRCLAWALQRMAKRTRRTGLIQNIYVSQLESLGTGCVFVHICVAVRIYYHRKLSLWQTQYTRKSQKVA